MNAKLKELGLQESDSPEDLSLKIFQSGTVTSLTMEVEIDGLCARRDEMSFDEFIEQLDKLYNEHVEE